MGLGFLEHKARVISVAGYAEDTFRRNLPEGEEFGFLPKPFSRKQLIEAVRGRRDEVSVRPRVFNRQGFW